MKTKRVIYDIETLSNAATFTFLDYDSGKVKQFVCWEDRNDWKKLVDYWKTITHLISFNGNHFDQPVMLRLLQDSGLIRDSGRQVAFKAYGFAQLVINRSEEDEVRKETFQLLRDTHFVSIDLFMYWSKMLRLSKKLSLKFFAHNLGMSIVEMPIHHTQAIQTEKELQQVLDYNLQDVKVTRALAEELKEQINLRIWVQQTYQLSCMSKDAPKIAQELILKSYSESTRQNKWELSKRRYFKPDPLYLKDWLPVIQFKTPFFQQVYQDMTESINGFKREYLYKNPDGSYLKLSYGIGGLHSLNTNEKWISTPKLQVKTIDAASLYPTLILNNGYVSPELGLPLLSIYRDIRTERLEAKKAREKQKDTFLKLCLNGFSGLADSPTCWLYAPEQILMMRMHGQLLLSRFLEELGLAGIKAISLNTDGIELLVSPLQQHKLDQIVREIEAEFQVQFESEDYRAIYYKTVNDYLAITNSGKVKEKGEFQSEKQIDASNEFLVIPKALRAYWVDGIQPDVFIRNHTDLFSFCAAKKIDRNYEVTYRGKKVQQLNRYLVSTKSAGAYLYKQKENKNPENVLKGIPVLLVNETTDKPAQGYPIDYQFYITKTWDTIRLFNPTQLDLFSSVTQSQAA